MIEWINFIILLVSAFLMSYLYTLSVQPMKREMNRGEKAWKECKTLRSIGGFFEFVITINIILWIWFPVPEFNWIIHSNILVGIIICIVMLVPCITIMLLGVKAAGKETLTPSKETEMYGGIYKYIRHPQTVGEFPMFVAIAFAFNSWFLVILMAVWIIIYIPIMVHYEEADLVRRFGESYKEYQKRTGALFPKLRKN